MSESIGIIASIIAALGIGGIIGAYFNSLFQHRRDISQREYELKRVRYGCILILMLTQLDPKIGLEKAKQFRQDLNTIEDVVKEIKAELLNGLVFANDEVIKSFSNFVRVPSYPSFIKVAISMRRDMFGKNTKINEDILSMFYDNK